MQVADPGIRSQADFPTGSYTVTVNISGFSNTVYDGYWNYEPPSVTAINAANYLGGAITLTGSAFGNVNLTDLSVQLNINSGVASTLTFAGCTTNYSSAPYVSANKPFLFSATGAATSLCADVPAGTPLTTSTAVLVFSFASTSTSFDSNSFSFTYAGPIVNNYVYANVLGNGIVVGVLFGAQCPVPASWAHTLCR